MLVVLCLQFAFLTRTLAITKDCSVNITLDALKSPLESEFSRPHFPNGFPANKSCGWYIKAPANHIIELQFKQAWINYDNVQVFDVFDKDGSERSLINLPRFYPKVVSRSQIVFISFKNNKSYKISYKAFKPGHFCSAKNSFDENQNILLTNPSGVMKTPGFPKDYTSALVRDCFWKIIAPRGHLVRLEFITFQIRVSDRVKISYDWNWWYPWYIYRLTPWHSFTVYSTGRQLGVQLFGADEVDDGVGFLANYTMVPAGDFSGTCNMSKNTTVRMRGEGRSFSSPRYPSNPGEGQCTWDISVPQGEYLKLTFWKFEGTCDQNYVEVYDTTNASSKLITKSCEATLFNQQVLYSIGNHLLLRFFSMNSSNLYGGFTSTYEAVKDIPAPYSCFDSVELGLDRNGSDFASFDFPLPYPNNAKCSWVITAPIGHVVRLEFLSFALQESRGCQADYVEVKEGFVEARPTFIGRFCGKSLPLAVQSKYPKMYVDFVSDILERYPGFHARYYFVPDPAVGPCNQDGVDNFIPLSGATGQIFSPRYPRLPAPRNISCTWIITVPQGQFVKLRVNRLKQDSGCSLLSVHDGRDLSSPLVKSFCEWDIFGLPRSYFSSGRYLLVHFYSPSLFWWFEAEFEAINQLPAPYSCTRKNLSGELSANSGTLASYNYPLLYEDQISCSWKITAGLFKRIVLSFDEFNLSDPNPVCLDYVQIGEEKLDNNRDSTTKFCGSMKPAPVTSSGEELYVWFIASGKTKHPGFKASYETEVSPLGIGVIVACCLGGTLVFIIIGNIGFKYFKARRKRGLTDRNREREDLHELCQEESL